MSLKPLEWTDAGLRMLDQRGLPLRQDWILLESFEEVAQAIRDMVIRGAPAIGIAAAYGMALAAKSGSDLRVATETLAESRPTAVNLFWALDRISKLGSTDFEAILAEAKAIELEDLQMNLSIGHHGARLIPENARILTICNTGALATAGHGTALGVIRSAMYQGNEIFVYSCETRPRMQGLRLTAFELTEEGIPFKSIADGAAASMMKAGMIDLVIAGADRIAANGDSANKIGTYALAVAAKHHGIPFYIAAPSSTLDREIPDGSHIPIEERCADELTMIDGVRVAPESCPVFNPAFDVTPGELITAIITEEGVFHSPYAFANNGA
ncbi:MAG: S-methyl-5-thioribose-1-phosphate isomerase [Fimbriimonadaceae bacterium]